MTAPAGALPVGPYSPAVRAGEWLFCSGQVGLVDGAIVDGGVAAEIRVAFARLAAILAEHGVDLDAVVKTTVFLTDMGTFAEMNDAYRDAFGDRRPARSAIGVVALPLGAHVEVEAVAFLGSPR